jgi:hypothetical protein
MNPLLQVARVSTADGDTIELAASAKSLASLHTETTPSVINSRFRSFWQPNCAVDQR